MLTLCVIIRKLQFDYLIFQPMIDKIIQKQHITNLEYESLIKKIQEKQYIDTGYY